MDSRNVKQAPPAAHSAAPLAPGGTPAFPASGLAGSSMNPSPAAGAAGMAETVFIGRQAYLVAALLTVLGFGVLLWPRGISTLAAPGGFLLDPGGRAATLASRLAPVTLVHFWATWCPPCIEESPGLQRLERDFSGRRDFKLLRVAVADSRSRVDTFLGAGAASVLYDPQWDVAHRYGTEQLPETYLVVHGHIVEKFIGAVNWDDTAVRQKIASHLQTDDRGKAGDMGGAS